MDRNILVYVDVGARPRLAGRLWARIRNGLESAAFEYDKSWLGQPDRFPLEPALALTPGPHHAVPETELFGAIGDSAPDRWGRLLMQRALRRRAEREGQQPRTLAEGDYLIMVNDEVRQGALRFAERDGGSFLAAGDGQPIPPIVDLPRLLAATTRFNSEDDTDEDLRLLLAPGASLGGARPKTSVRDLDGHLAIAKFPHGSDKVGIELWEALALTLAARARIGVPAWRIAKITGKPVLVLRRFDRKGGCRVPFLSAMSMLGASDNDPRSYLEIVDAIRRYGASPETDMRELWRRLIFSIMISNTDDHLRNHGFLYTSRDGWRLSPAYDLHPVPVDVKPRVLSTSIDLDDATASLELAESVSSYFGLTPTEAATIAAEVGTAVSRWRHFASQLGLSRKEIDRMASAFEHADLKQALALPVTG